MNDFDSLSSKSNSYGEANDCSVKAIALCLNTTYEDAHNLAEEYGREPLKGMNRGDYLVAMKNRNCNFKFLFKRRRIVKNGRRSFSRPEIYDNRCRGIVTAKDLDRLPSKGTFLIRSSCHVFVYQDGKVKDWTEDKRNRIIEILEVDNSNAEKNLDAKITTYIPKKRTRKTSYCWKLIRLDTGETICKYKRKPTKQIANIKRGGYIPSLGRNVKIDIVRI